jgi:hypothetical protein
MSSTKRKIEDTVKRPYILKLEQQRKAIHEFVDRDSTSIVMQYMPEMVPFSLFKRFRCTLYDIHWFNPDCVSIRYRARMVSNKVEPYHSNHDCRCHMCNPFIMCALDFSECYAHKQLIEILAGVHKIKFD